MRKYYEVTLAKLTNTHSPHKVRVPAKDQDQAIKKAKVWARDPA